MAAALVPPPSVAGAPPLRPAAEEELPANSSTSQNGDDATTQPSNISVVDTSKEEGLEQAKEVSAEYEYPDGGLRGEAMIERTL